MPCCMTDWANLCILGYVLNIIGPFNCANLVCKGWKNCKKIYVDVKISTYREYDMMLNHMCIIQIQKLDLGCYDRIFDVDALSEFIGLKILILNERVQHSNKLFSAISKLNRLEGIRLGGCVGICNENMRELRTCSNLRKLWMFNGANNCIDDDGIEILCEFELEELFLGKCAMTDKGCHLLSRMKEQSMRELSFWRCNIGNDGFKSVCTMTSLKGLGIGECTKITELSSLSNLKELEYLNVEKSGFTNEGLCELIGLTSLRCLNICECGLISNKGMVYISHLIWLEELWLDYVKITDEGLLALGSLKKLRELGIGGCVKITDCGMRVICEMASLEILSLRHCGKLTNESMKYVGESRTICEVDIYGCGLIDDHGVVLLGNMPKLRELITGQNNISSLGRDALRDLLRPRMLKIKYYERYV